MQQATSFQDMTKKVPLAHIEVFFQLRSPSDRRGVTLPDPRAGLSKTFGTLRSVTSSLRSATANVAANATGQVRGSVRLSLGMIFSN